MEKNVRPIRRTAQYMASNSSFVELPEIPRIQHLIICRGLATPDVVDHKQHQRTKTVFTHPQKKLPSGELT